MLTAGATDGNGHVAAVFRFEARQPGLCEAQNILKQMVHLWLRLQKFGNVLVLAGERTQFGFPVWVGQTGNDTVEESAALIRE